MTITAEPPSLLSLTELIVTRARDFKDTFILGVPDKQLKITTYTYGQLELAINLLATHYAGVIPPRTKGDDKTKLTVALLAPSGYDYVINELALSRLGYSVLFVSVNNSAPAIAHLCRETGSSVLFVAPRYRDVANDALAFLPEGYALKLQDLADPGVYDREQQSLQPFCVFERPLTPQQESSMVGFIVHSSGSTGFPKPIYTIHMAFMFNIAGNFGLSGFTTLPLYHNHGHSCLYRAFYSRKPLWLFPASDLPLTTSNVLGVLKQPEVTAEALFGVPYVYKLLGETEEGIAALKKLKLCLFGGSAMPTELGDALVEAGVKLVGHYGATETGQLMTSFRPYETDKEWEWNRVSAQLAPFVKFEEREDGAFEIVVLDGWKGKVVQNRPDGSYALGDLFEKHPTRPNLWRFIGRIDDTLVLVNGEKVQSTPIELTLKGETPFIQEAIVFGSGRSQAGALILLSEAVDPSLSRDAILALIQPAVAVANSAAPSHSHLSTELLILLPFGTPIPRADKGSFIRRRVYVEFAEVIEAAYAALEGDGDDKDKRKVGTLEETEDQIFELVKTVSGASQGLGKDTDLFSYGLDSLAAGRIRNALQRDLDLRGNKLSTNFVFEHPTIALAAKYLVALSSGNELEELSQVDQMRALVEKYRHFDVPSHLVDSNAAPPPSLEVVILTGTTGSLGANTLAALLRLSSVKKVYNLVRAKTDAEAAVRVKASLAEKGLTGGDDPRVVSLATSNFSLPFLGLSEERYEEIKHDIRTIFHFAWAVNFSLNISSFEPHIRGVCNFINLSLESDHLAPFYFASSVSAVARWPGPGSVPEAVTPDPETAQDMGYARSKWVVEKLCEIASKTLPVRAVVLRIGQMVGSTLDGRWNETEAVSLMFKTGDTLHALPALPETPAWLPVDTAVDVILELASLPPGPRRTSQVWHVMQPRTITFASVLDSLEAAGMKFERVTPKEWVNRLRTGPQDPIENPPIKLLQFFENKYDHPPGEDTVVKRYPLDCEKTLKSSKCLREAPLVGKEQMGKFVECWRSTGFLGPPAAKQLPGGSPEALAEI